MKNILKSVSLMLLTFALGATTQRVMASFYDLVYSGTGVQVDYTVRFDGANYNEFASNALFSSTLDSLTLTPVSAVPEVNLLVIAACAVVVGLFVIFRRWKLVH
jgi:hypothetical protein